MTASIPEPPSNTVVYASGIRATSFGDSEVIDLAPTAVVLERARRAFDQEDFDAAVVWSASAVEVAYVHKRKEFEGQDPDSGKSVRAILKDRMALDEKLKALANDAGSPIGGCSHWQPYQEAVFRRNCILHRGTSAPPETARNALKSAEGMCAFIEGLHRPT